MARGDVGFPWPGPAYEHRTSHEVPVILGLAQVCILDTQLTRSLFLLMEI